MNFRIVTLIALGTALMCARVSQGATVSVPGVGSLPPGKSTTIKFSVTVAGVPSPAMTPSISQQAAVTATGPSVSIMTDDPATGAPNDPTVTAISYGPDATIVLASQGPLVQGQSGILTVDVFNTGGVALDPATRSISIQLPPGFTRPMGVPTTIAGWTVPDSYNDPLNMIPGTLTKPHCYYCFRSDTLTPGQHYPLLQLPVNIAPNATSTVNVLATLQEPGADVNTGNNSSNFAAPVVLVPTVAAPANALYRTGQNLDFIASYTEAVTVTGAPRIGLDVGGARIASYTAAGSTSTALLFRYTVQAGDLDSNGIASSSPIVLNGGTINDASPKPAGLGFGVPNTTGVLVDGVAPTIQAVASPAPGTYLQGQNIDYIVTFSEAVILNISGGSPRIPITVGATARISGYISGSGTASLLFRHTVQAGDLDTDGIVIGSPLNLNNATIKDAAGNDILPAGLTFTSPTTTAVLVDGVAPTISSVVPPANQFYSTGQNIDFTVNFTEPVNVNTVGGMPTLSLTVGATARSATFLSGNNSSALVFRHTVVAGDNDSDGITVTSPVQLNLGTIRDIPGNPAELTFMLPNTSGVNVDTGPPLVQSIVRASANPTNAASVTFTVTFSENVTGVNSADFALAQVGVTGASITNVTGSNATYTVTVNTGSGSGTLGLNLADNNSIIDSATNSLGGPALGDGNFTGQIYDIDKTVPTVDSILRMTPATALTNAATVVYAVTFSEPVTGVDPNDFNVVLTGSVGMNSPVVINGSGQDYTVTVNGITGAGTLRLDFSASANVTDAVGNAVPAAAVTGQTYIIDRVGPQVLSVVRTNPSTTNLASVNYAVTFSGSVTGVDASDFALTTAGLAGASITGFAGSGANYTVTVGNYTGDGTLRLDVNNDGTIIDQAGNSLAVNEVQVVTVSGSSGTFVLTYKDQSTTALAFNASAAAVQSALNALSTIGGAGGSVAVTQSGSVYTVTFGGNLAGTNLIQLVTFASGGATAVASTPVEGGPATVPFAGETYIIDRTKPTLTISPPSLAFAKAGNTVSYTVQFSDANFQNPALDSSTISGLLVFNKTGTADSTLVSLTANPGETFATVTFSQLSGNGTISFTVGANSVTDRAGNTNDAFGPSEAFTVDTIVPTITSITTTSGFFNAGKNLDFIVNFAEIVNVSSTPAVIVPGVPSLGLTIGATTQHANYVSGSGTSALLFRYTVAPGDNDSDGIALTTLTLNGGIIEDPATNVADLAFTAPNTAGVIVDTIAPNADSLVVPTNGTYGAGQALDFILQMSENTLVAGGVPELTLNIGGVTQAAVFISGSGTTSLLFRYVVQAGDTDSDGITYQGVNLSGATLQDAATNNATTAVSPPSLSNVLVDTTPPFIVFVSGPPGGWYRAGQTLTYELFINEPVFVGGAGIPTITLAMGSVIRGIPYLSGSGTARLTFQYTIVTGDTDNDGVEISSPLVLNGATIQDAGGNNMALNFVFFLSEGEGGMGTAPQVDTTPPALVIGPPSVTQTKTGPVSYLVTYTESNALAITLTAADITVNSTGPAAAGTVTVSAGTTANERLVTLSNLTGFGTLSITVKAGTASDIAGNLAPAAGPSAVVRLNSAPTATVTLSPAPPSTNDKLVATVVSVDIDNDPLTYTYVWRVGGVIVRTVTATASATDTLDLIVAGNGDSGDVITLQVTPFDGQLSGPAANATITVGPPVFLSGPNVTPNPPFTFVQANFNVTVDQTNLTVTWNFGDGSALATGLTPSHIYSTPGTYNVTVTATNPLTGSSSTAVLVVNVLDIADSNLSFLPGTTSIRVTRGTILLGGTKNKVTLNGIIHIFANEKIGGAKFDVSINGVLRSFTLDDKGGAKTADGSIRIQIKRKKGVVLSAESKISVTMTGPDILTDIKKGIALGPDGMPKAGLILFKFNGRTLSYIADLKFRTAGSMQLAQFKFDDRK